MSKNICNNSETRREDWPTPVWLFKYLDGPAGFDFGIDLAAMQSNALCDLWIGERENALSLTHARLVELGKAAGVDVDNRWAWCNPPYGRSGIGKWAPMLTGVPKNIVSLIPASVGAKWFRPFWNTATAIVLVAKRLHFGGAQLGAQFDSALFIKGDKLSFAQIEDLKRIGTVVLAPGVQNWSGEAAWELAKSIVTEPEES